MLSKTLRVYWNGFREKGLVQSFKILLERVRNGQALWLIPRIVGFLLVPLYVLISPMFWALRVRLIVNHTSLNSFRMIGHLAGELDGYVRDRITGRVADVRGLIVFPADRAANTCLLNYWRRHFFVISQPILARILAPLNMLGWIRHSVARYIINPNATSEIFPANAAYGHRPALLNLTPEHRERGRQRLREFGLPEDAWFVCLHAREPSYHKGFAPADCRNVSIENYFPAIQAIVDRGGWCVRLGDPGMSRLPPLPGVVDYAHDPRRSDWMDVFLCAECRFFLGCASGLCFLASVFGRPVAGTNQIAPSLILSVYLNDLIIPKLIWSETLGRYLTLAELAESQLGNAIYNYCFTANGLVAHENLAEDIRELVEEMFEELAGQFQETDEDRDLRAKVRSLPREGQCGYGGAGRMGRRFLRKHRGILLPVKPPQSKFSKQIPQCGSPECPCLAADKLPE